jgi:tetratricopeptide (TPR) repeat protein
MDNERPFSGNLRMPGESLLILSLLPANFFISGRSPIPRVSNLQPAIRAMKKLILILALAASLPAHADKAAEIYKQGMIAVSEGNAKAAELAFKEVLRLQPGNANARYQLAELKQNQGSLAARQREKRMGEFVIPQVDFDKVELAEAVAALAIMVEEQSKGEFAPNFMVQDPSSKLAGQTVTLQIKGVPAKAVLDMMLKQVGAVRKYEQHAVIIRPVPRSGN